MDKRRAIQIITKAAGLYRDNLEDQKVLFLYGTPSDVKRQLSVLKKDIRDVTAQPTYKVFAVISKHYTEDKYLYLAKLDKSIDIKECHFSEEIERLIERDKL